jgi:hypothetical protein
MGRKSAPGCALPALALAALVFPNAVLGAGDSAASGAPGRIDGPAKAGDASPLTCLRPAPDRRKMELRRNPKPALPIVPIAKKPDLMFHGIQQYGVCGIRITIGNKGPGAMPASAYGEGKGVMVTLYDGNKLLWMRALVKFDPGRKLQQPGAYIHYVLQLKGGGMHPLTIVLDSRKTLAETNESNNTAKVNLPCPDSLFD